jgi:hypothetical protein
MTLSCTLQAVPKLAQISSRPGVAHLTLATPPGNGAPLSKGADSCTPPGGPIRARDFTTSERWSRHGR